MLVADLLCGAGGTSTGAELAFKDLGIEMELVCLNHWPVAIETHQRNHPKARHYCQDISTVRPHLIVPEGYLDLLLASPTCTHHSVARGGKPTSDQQRSDPWHIVTWFTELRVKRAIIENVWEFVKWGPVDARTCRPIKSREGEYFRAWVDTIRRLGGEPEWRKLNAADYGDATTRQRFFMMIRFDGRRIAWPNPTHMRREPDVLPLGLKPWRPARDIIDWSIKGKSIFARKKPLSPKTLARIHAGAVKFGWPEPFLVILRNHMDAQSVDGPLPSVAANGNHIALAQPVITNGRRGNKAKGVDVDPVPTLDTKGGVWLAEPITIDECGRPFVVLAAHGNSPHERDPNGRRVKSLDDPLGAIHAGGGNFAIAEPFVFSRQGEGAPRSVDQPIPTQCAVHSPVLIAPYYGSGSGETCRDAKEPLPTVTAKARFGMVVPITHSAGSSRARQDSDPLPTITTANRGELAFIAASFGERDGQAPRVHGLDLPLPTICAQGRVDLAEPVLVNLKGRSDVTALDEPAPTVTSHSHLAVADVEGYDILFRMLEPHELAAAMGFSSDGAGYEFSGNKTEQIRQIGNAVPVNTARALVKAAMADAAPKRRARASAARKAEAA
ncbi:MAG: DNA cytosine methyltransferase [Rhodospirillales bacterium]|nr:DNA cytosine methyltransferase [Rhodospirillales bacterium]